MERKEIASILALVGSVIGLGGGLMMLLMTTIMFGVGADPTPFFGAGYFALLVGWIALFQLAGGIALIVGGVKLRRPGASREGAGWSIAGGVLVALGGNFLAASLGIIAGVIVPPEPPRA